MNKDVIYIDVEDDITAIIGKIKASKEKIVALVPPKRIGALQSAVNLRLLARIAENSNKRLVVVTNNKALIALSASALIPVAKNLQSKPELAEIPALVVDDGDDIIDGALLPVGDLADAVDPKKSDEPDVDIDGVDVETDYSKKPIPIVNNRIKSNQINLSKGSSKNKTKIPNFSRFRKKLFIIAGLAILLIAFLVWAIGYAPAAKVIITAKTTPSPVSMSVKLGGTSATDVSTNIIQTVSKQIKKDTSVDFTATGQKDVGTKAVGSISVRNCDYSEGFTLPAGTEFKSSGGLTYTNVSATSVPGFSGSSSGCSLGGSSSGKATVQVQAAESGDKYNNSGLAYTIGSIPAGSKVDAQGTAITGGTSKVLTIVTASDVQTASQALADIPSDDVKQQLIKQFTNGEAVIGDSFAVSRATAVSTPAIGSEATGKAKLTSQTTYSISAIAKSELQVYLKDALNKQINSAKSQRIYSDGADKVVLSGYTSNDQVSSINIATTGQIGPNIDDAAIKEQVKGKRFGDIQSQLSTIPGVSNVDVKFSYFWVGTVPNDINKIDVEFKLQNG